MKVRALLVSLSFILFAALAPAPAAAAENIGSADALAGLWKAKKRFGPDARGTLTMLRSGSAFVADFAGRTISVATTNGELTFDLPGGEGTFRGKLDRDGAIHGHWYRPGTPVNGADRTTAVAASRVTLKPDGANQWRGSVEPLEDTFTFYLLAQKRPDGTVGVVLRNPERDIGTQYAVERLTRDGNAVRLIGSRGGKELEVAAGTYDAENETLMLRFPNRGGTYDFVRDSDDSAFYPRGKRPERYVYRAPLRRDDGWPVSTLDAAGIDRATIEKLVQRFLDMPMDSRDAPQLHALLVARHGKLVVEEYFHEHERDKLHDLRSAGKSLTALVAGAAMQAGVPLKLSTPVYQVMNGGTFPPDLEPQKRAMTLEDLLTMSAGFFCDDTNEEAPGNEETMSSQTDEPDYYRYTMAVPMATPPGEKSVYCSALPNLALGMVGRAARENPMSLFDRLIGRPMQIERYAWSLDPAGNPYGGGGPQLTARDFMKLGQLLLDGGTWRGRRIVSEEFASRAGAPLYHLRNITYGYLWWSEAYPYKQRTVHAFSARGAGGQTTTVVPELGLVVTTLAGNYFSRKGMFAASTDLVPQVLLPAVRERGDDPNAPVTERQYVSPYGRSTNGSRVQVRP